MLTTATTSAPSGSRRVGDRQRVRRAATGGHRDERRRRASARVRPDCRDACSVSSSSQSVPAAPPAIRATHAAIGQPERAGQFGRLGERYPSGRPGSDEDQPAAAVHPVGDQFGAAHDLPAWPPERPARRAARRRAAGRRPARRQLVQVGTRHSPLVMASAPVGAQRPQRADRARCPGSGRAERRGGKSLGRPADIDDHRVLMAGRGVEQRLPARDGDGDRARRRRGNAPVRAIR